MKSGVNYAQFLGLKSIGTTQRHAHIQDTVDEHMVLQLPSMTEVSLTGAEAPVALYHPDDAAVSHDPDSNYESKDNQDEYTGMLNAIMRPPQDPNVDRGSALDILASTAARNSHAVAAVHPQAELDQPASSRIDHDALLNINNNEVLPNDYPRDDLRAVEEHAPPPAAKRARRDVVGTDDAALQQYVPGRVGSTPTIILLDHGASANPTSNGATKDTTLQQYASSRIDHDASANPTSLISLKGSAPLETSVKDKVSDRQSEKITSQSGLQKRPTDGTGSLSITDSNGVPMHIGTDGTVDYVTATVNEVPPPSENDISDWDMTASMHIDLDDGIPQSVWDENEQRMMEQESSTFVVKNAYTTWMRVVRHHKIDPVLASAYRQWMIYHSPESDSITEDTIPEAAGQFLQVGMKFPYPTGYATTLSYSAKKPVPHLRCITRNALRHYA